MNVLAAWILGALVLDVTLGAVVFLAHPRRTLNQHYLTLTVSVALLLLANWRITRAGDPLVAMFWIRLATASASLIPTVCNILRLCVMEPGLDWWRALWKSRALLAINLAIIGVCFSPGFIESVQMPEPPTLTIEPVYGPGFVVFVAYFFGVIVYLATAFAHARRRTAGAPRAEMGFLILGSLVALVSGAVFSPLTALLTHSSRSVPIANALSVIALNCIIGYGVATRRIMPVSEAMRRVTGAVLLSVYLTLVYLGAWFVAQRTGVFVIGRDGRFFLPHLIAAVVAALAAGPIRGRVQSLTQRLFTAGGWESLTRALEGASRMLQSVTTVDSLVSHLVAFVKRAVQTDCCLVLLRRDGRYGAPPSEDGGDGPSVSEADPLVERLRSRREPLVLAAVDRRRTTPSERAAAGQLAELEGEIALGIYGKAQLEGILLLGGRRRGGLYGPVEQDALQILANQAAVALENAELYTRIQREKEETEHLLDNLLSGVIAVSGDRRITVFNHVARRLSGAPPGRYIGRPMEELPSPFADLVRVVLEKGATWLDREIALPGKGESGTVVRVSGAVLAGVPNEQRVALLVFNDVTRLKDLENQVRRTDRLASIGTLSAGMAHEIRNPLVSIKTFAQLLPTRYEDPDFRDTFTPIIAHEVERIDGIVKQLLDFARPRSASLAPVHLHELIRASVKLSRHRLRPYQVEIVEQFEAASDRILGDATLLEQAFVNLFLNAGDAMGGSGRLVLRTETLAPAAARGGAGPARRRVRATVTDSGCGIAERDLAKIFDPFFTSKASGTGLGLSVVHGIIQEHHASIDVTSRIGDGTTFILVFDEAPETEEEGNA